MCMNYNFIKYQELYSNSGARWLLDDGEVHVLGWQENCNDWQEWSRGFHPTTARLSRKLFLEGKMVIHSCYSPIPEVTTWQGFDKLLAYTSKRVPQIPPTHHYVCMNFTMRPHRAYLIEQLAVEDVFELGRISWGDREPPLDAGILNQLQRKTRKKYRCEEPWMEAQDEEQWQLPPVHDMPSPPVRVWADTAFNLVTETHHNKEGSIVTEKIWQPMWHARPVLCNGPVNVHQHLVDNGYRLMEDIDYSFDSIKEERTRVERLAQQVAQLCKRFSPAQIVKRNREVSLHNQRRIYQQVLEEGMPWAVTAPGVCSPGAKDMREHLVGVWYAIRNSRR